MLHRSHGADASFINSGFSGILNISMCTSEYKAAVWDENLPVPKVSTLSACFVVFVVAVACYSISYDADFVFDDTEAIINNKDVSEPFKWTELFIHDFWGNKMASNYSHKSYRPFTVILFR